MKFVGGHGFVHAAALLAALAFTVSAAGPANAQDPQSILGGSGGTGGDVPVAIDATEGIEWRQDEKVYIAKGNAKAVRGDVTVAANELRAHYRLDEKEQTQVYKVEAIGNVVITTKNETITGGYGIYMFDVGVFRLTGGLVSIERKGGEKVTATKVLEYRQKERIAIADGDATVYKEDKTLKADRLTAYFSSGKKQELERVEATGGVIVTTKQEVVRAKRADYDAAREVVVLTGDVRLTRGGNQLNGERAEVDLKKGRSRLLAGTGGGTGGKPVSGLFVPGTKGAPSLDGIMKSKTGDKKPGSGAGSSGGTGSGSSGE